MRKRNLASAITKSWFDRVSVLDSRLFLIKSNMKIGDNLLDKSLCSIYECKFKDIRHIFEEFHYKKGHMGGGISMCFAMCMNGEIVGGSVLGKPRHERKYKNCIDIRRMACLDSSPKNSESYFLGQVIKWIKQNTDYNHVLSYSDTTQGHMGTIYKASNFRSIGLTSKTKYVMWNGIMYHPRSLSVDRDYSYRMRAAVKTGEAQILEGLPKVIWMYDVLRKSRNGYVSNFKNIEAL